jgi:hypothetical protein
MDLDSNHIGLFNYQIALAMTSLGIPDIDASAFETKLNVLFNNRCSLPSQTSPMGGGTDLQSFCLKKSCPLASKIGCALYPNGGVGVQPSFA